MPNATGLVKKIYPNNGKPKLILDNGLEASAFKAEQMPGVVEGCTVSFAYEEKAYNGKVYNNIKGQVAIISAGQQAGAATPSAAQAQYNPAHMPSLRNGAQVGAAINQAIEFMKLTGEEPSMDNVEHAAKQFLLVGDRLSSYKG